MDIKYNVVMPTVYGDVILNRNDTWQTVPLMNTGKSFSHEDITFLCRLAEMCGEDTVCMDIGANCGFYSLALGNTLKPLNGKVISIEGQRIIYYMLAGSVALNAIENVHVHHMVMGKEKGMIPIPQYDYSKKGSFGSVEFKTVATDVEQERMPDNPYELVGMINLDSMVFKRLDLLKIDAEGMEQDILDGGIETLRKFKPLVWIEWLKSDYWKLVNYFVDLGYNVYEHGTDMFCIQPEQFPELQKEIDFWRKLHIVGPTIKLSLMGPGIGDICMGLGTAHALHDAGYRVSATAEEQYHEFIKACPFIYSVSEVDRKNEIWTCAWNQLQPKHQVDEYIEFCGLKDAPNESKSMVVNVPQTLVEEVVKTFPGKDRIILHTASSVPSRKWPIEYWQELANRLRAEGIEVVATKITKAPWTPETEEGIEGFPLVLNPTLMESVAIFGQSKLLISADSGPIQLAGMTECGILGLYSVMAPEHRLPYRHGQMGWNAYGIMTNCPEAPCYPKMVGNYDYHWSEKALEMCKTLGLPATVYNWCLNEEAPVSCMKTTSVDEVFNKAMEMYRSQS